MMSVHSTSLEPQNHICYVEVHCGRTSRLVFFIHFLFLLTENLEKVVIRKKKKKHTKLRIYHYRLKRFSSYFAQI